MLCPVPTERMVLPGSAYGAMAGFLHAGAISLRAWYAVSGTDVVYGGCQHWPHTLMLVRLVPYLPTRFFRRAPKRVFSTEPTIIFMQISVLKRAYAATAPADGIGSLLCADERGMKNGRY